MNGDDNLEPRFLFEAVYFLGQEFIGKTLEFCKGEFCIALSGPGVSIRNKDGRTVKLLTTSLGCSPNSNYKYARSQPLGLDNPTNNCNLLLLKSIDHSTKTKSDIMTKLNIRKEYGIILSYYLDDVCTLPPRLHMLARKSKEISLLLARVNHYS
ncbi:hypothetical protein QQP08_026649 [Theobroma cacao]|nr:hypothetical protein QQP08_026649 [Theobroma cacao]